MFEDIRTIKKAQVCFVVDMCSGVEQSLQGLVQDLSVLKDAQSMWEPSGEHKLPNDNLVLSIANLICFMCHIHRESIRLNWCTDFAYLEQQSNCPMDQYQGRACESNHRDSLSGFEPEHVFLNDLWTLLALSMSWHSVSKHQQTRAVPSMKITSSWLW